MPVYRETLPRIDKAVLTENHEELVRQITPKDIYNSLFQRRVIDLDELNKIKQEERQHGRRAGVEELLDIIQHSGPHGLDNFIDSLESSGYRSLAKKLQESCQTINRTGQESRNESCAGDKDYTIRLEKNDVKRRGKIPSWHEEVLRKNYLSIMRDIRVDDIIDYLYTKQVIDWDDMDVIKTKLRSEGNREALRCLLAILHKFSHTALPTFVQCLKQTGYSQLADRLQDDLDSGNKISSCHEETLRKNDQDRRGLLIQKTF